jgi:hypothetical protein
VFTQKITKLFVDKLALPESGQVFYRDNILKGFAVRVTAGGSKAFITVAESLDISGYAIKRLVNHKNGSDVTEGYIINNHDRLRDLMQRITDFFKQHAHIKEDDYVPQRD